LSLPVNDTGNMGVNALDRRIIFVHQPKTAGTTLIDAFKETYGSDAVYHDEDNQLMWKMDEFRKSIETRIQPYRIYKDRELYRVIHGHIDYEKYKRSFPDAFYLTFFRHPVQQITSRYYYWLRSCNPSDTNPMRRWVSEERPGLEEFVTEWCKESDLEQYAQSLNVYNFDFIGIVERYDDSMKMLKLHIQDLVVKARALRVNPDKQAGEAYVLEIDVEKKLVSMLKPLIAVYEEAVNRFDSDYEKIKEVTA